MLQGGQVTCRAVLIPRSLVFRRAPDFYPLYVPFEIAQSARVAFLNQVKCRFDLGEPGLRLRFARQNDHDINARNRSASRKKMRFYVAQLSNAHRFGD